MQKVTVVYDGECPFCQRFVAWQKLRDTYDLELIDARQCENLQALAQGRDLNEGMLVIYDGNHYFGADAISILAELNGDNNKLRSAFQKVFRSRPVSKFFYPGFRLIRNTTLRLLGRKKIEMPR